MALTALLVGGSALGVGLRLPRTYTASLLIAVEAPRQPALSGLPTLVQSALGGADPTMLQTLATRLSSMTLLEAARRDLSRIEPEGAKRLPPLPLLAKSVRASVETGSSLLRVTVALREAEGGARNAALFANQLVETFRRQLAQESRDDRQRQAKIQLELIQKKKRELVSLLDATREDLIAFARSQGSQTIWGTELAQLRDQLNALAEERRAAEAQRRRAESEQQFASATLEQEPELTVTAQTESPPAMRTYIEQELLSTRAEAAKRAGEGLAEASPERRGLAAAEQFLAERRAATPERETTTTIGLNPRRDWLFERKHDSDVTLATVEQELAVLDRMLQEAKATLKTRSEQIPEYEMRLSILQRQAESLARLYDELLLRENETDLALGQAAAETEEGNKVGGISIVDAARPELRPVRPRALYLFAAATTLGILSGLMVGLVAEWRGKRPDAASEK